MAEIPDNVAHMPVKTTRLHINIPVDTLQTLKRLVNETGATSATEGVRRAIGCWEFFVAEKAKGNRLAVIETDPEGKTTIREIILVNG